MEISLLQKIHSMDLVYYTKLAMLSSREKPNQMSQIPMNQSLPVMGVETDQRLPVFDVTAEVEAKL